MQNRSLHALDIQRTEPLVFWRLQIVRDRFQIRIFDALSRRELADDEWYGIMITPFFIVTKPSQKNGEILETLSWLRIGTTGEKKMIGTTSTLYKSALWREWYLDLGTCIPNAGIDHQERYIQIKYALEASQGKVTFFYEVWRQCCMIIGNTLFWFTYGKSGAWDLATVQNVAWCKSLENLRVTYPNGGSRFFNLDRGQQLGFAADWQPKDGYENIYLRNEIH